jgi:hypothetical protein
MPSTTMPVKELLYTMSFHFTRVEEYGLAMSGVLSGSVPIPPQGARFDISVEGQVVGTQLAGKITATDYVMMRADGNARVHVHGAIVTNDGARIAFFSDGVFLPGTPAQLRESVTLQTACPQYLWVNGLEIWATGTTDPSTGQAKLKGYVA